MKKIIIRISTIILFCCILFYKNTNAAVIFNMNSNTVIYNTIYAVDGDTGIEVQIKNLVSVMAGQSFNLKQVCNIDEILEAGGKVDIENIGSLTDFPDEYTYNQSAISLDDIEHRISVNEIGIAVLKITININQGQDIIYLAVNGIDSIDNSMDTYNAIKNIQTGTNSSDNINTFEDAYDIYIDYYTVLKLVEESPTFEADINIQHDGFLNIWKITNGNRYIEINKLLSEYFGTKQLSLQEIQFISEFEGIVIRFDHEVTEDDLLAYAFYNKKEYVPDTGIILNATIQNLDNISYQEFIVYKGYSEIVLQLDKEHKQNGIYSVEISGIGTYISKAEFTFQNIFTSINKGAFIKKKTPVYSGIYNGSVTTTAKANRRYQCVAKSVDGWYRLKLADGTFGYIRNDTASLSDSAIDNVVDIYDTKYSYADMSRDINKMAKFYQDVMEVSVLTSTADSNKVYCARLGNADAKKKVLIHASMHAREWLNSQLVMKMLERCCKYYYSGKYNGILYSKLFNDVCFYVVPMLNPDGVNISQYGLSKIKSASLKKLVKRLGKGRYSRWKANARGVDLNRNFSVGFRKDTARGTKRGPEGYSGPYACSERETKAMVKFINQVKPKAVINYHEAGRIIYYTKSSSLLSLIKQKTGYRTIYESISGANGSFGDYLTRKGIVWCTPETCSGSAPVNHSQFYYEWGKHRDVIPAIAKLYSP